MAAVVQVLLGLLLAACVLSSPKYSASPNNQEDLEASQDRQKPYEEKFYVKDEVIENILNKAAFGVDIFQLDPMETFDTGVREAIFRPTTHFIDSENVVLNNFFKVPQEYLRCQGHIEMNAMVSEVKNVKDYLQSQFPSFEVNKNTNIVDHRNRTVAVKTSIDYIEGTNHYRDKIASMFNSTAIGIIMKNWHCLTHVVSIDSDIKPVFTQSFSKALQLLNMAAKVPESEDSRHVFKQFVTKFGTHYQTSTHFGTAIIYEKIYSSQSNDIDERRHRLKCASLALKSAVKLMHNTKDSDAMELEKCELLDSYPEIIEKFKLPSLRMVSLGSPLLNSGIIANGAKQVPAVIHYRLKSISSLFKENWFESMTIKNSDNIEESLNSTAMFDFFASSMINYCVIILGAPCEVITESTQSQEVVHSMQSPTMVDSTQSPVVVDSTQSPKVIENTKPCDVANICGADHNCYEEPHSCKGYICVYSGPGKALIVGGFDGGSVLRETESLPQQWSPPQLPRAVWANTLVATSDHFYSCGGYEEGGATADCYRLHRHETDATWQLAQPLPKPAHRFTSVMMGNNNIWHVDGGEIHNFDATTGEYTTTSLPFSVHSYYRHCAVSNGNYSYVIGVGDNSDEIWVNTISRDEKSWQKVGGSMKHSRNEHACVWYDSNIMITGWFETHYEVEIFNTETNTIREISRMPQGLCGHAMMLYDGYPTVVGGWDGSYGFKNLESYDIGTGEWFTQDIKLKEARTHFGMVEIEPHLGVRGDGQC